jgi:hypothetical protein
MAPPILLPGDRHRRLKPPVSPLRIALGREPQDDGVRLVPNPADLALDTDSEPADSAPGGSVTGEG